MKHINAMKSIVFLTFFLSIHADQLLFFTNLFPVSWYEKGLHTTILMLDNFSKRAHQKIDSDNFDTILGRCAFADFCFTKMSQQGQLLIDEDVAYIMTILHALEAKIVHHDTIEKERVECFLFMTARIKKYLKMPYDI